MAAAKPRKAKAPRRARKPAAAEREEAFIIAYLADPKRNGAAAAIVAGYSERNARFQASRMLARANVRQRVAEADANVAPRIVDALDRYAVSKERIIRELAVSAFNSMADYIRIDGGVPIVDLSACDRDHLSAIAELTVEHVQIGSGEDAQTVRRIKVKPYDRNAALEKLAKITGHYTEKQEHAIPALDALLETVRGISRRSALPIGSQRVIEHREE